MKHKTATKFIFYVFIDIYLVVFSCLCYLLIINQLFHPRYAVGPKVHTTITIHHGPCSAWALKWQDSRPTFFDQCPDQENARFTMIYGSK